MILIVPNTGSSTTSTICNKFFEGPTDLFELQCFNFHDTLRLNYTLDTINVIKLIKNDLHTLDALSFPPSETVKVVYLNANEIDKIEEKTFKVFPNLQVLDLTQNNFTQLDSNILINNEHMIGIYLDNNPLETLTPTTFKHLKYLKTVSLEGCKRLTCNKETVETLLYFKQNNITTDNTNLCAEEIITNLLERLHECEEHYTLCIGALYEMIKFLVVFFLFIIVSCVTCIGLRVSVYNVKVPNYLTLDTPEQITNFKDEDLELIQKPKLKTIKEETLHSISIV